MSKNGKPIVGRFAGSLEQIDRLTGVSCIEWAGNDVLVYTERDAQGRPFRVLVRMIYCIAADRSWCSLLRTPPLQPHPVQRCCVRVLRCTYM